MEKWTNLVKVINYTKKRLYDGPNPLAWAETPMPQTLAGKLIEHDRLCRNLRTSPGLTERRDKIERELRQTTIGQEVLQMTGRLV